MKRQRGSEQALSLSGTRVRSFHRGLRCSRGDGGGLQGFHRTKSGPGLGCTRPPWGGPRMTCRGAARAPAVPTAGGAPGHPVVLSLRGSGDCPEVGVQTHSLSREDLGTPVRGGTRAFEGNKRFLFSLESSLVRGKAEKRGHQDGFQGWPAARSQEAAWEGDGPASAAPLRPALQRAPAEGSARCALGCKASAAENCPVLGSKDDQAAGSPPPSPEVSDGPQGTVTFRPSRAAWAPQDDHGKARVQDSEVPDPGPHPSTHRNTEIVGLLLGG